MTDGMKLEDLCVGYLQRIRRCTETYYDDDNVRLKLQLPKHCKCADVLSLHQPERTGVREVTIAEAKAAGSAVPERLAIQLGTAAAAAFAMFPKLVRVNLAIFTDRLVWAAEAKSKGSDATKVVADLQPWPDGKLKPVLYETSAERILRPGVDEKADGGLLAYSSVVGQLLIEVILVTQLSERPLRSR